MPSEVQITTGCRLHLGLLATSGSPGRSYGGAGVMLDSPGFQFTMRKAATTHIKASEEITFRATSFLQSATAHLPETDQNFELEFHQELPSHAGLGSGTQMGMAIANGVARLTDDPDANDPQTLASRVGRGKRSAIGIHGYFHGGFLVDGGKQRLEELSPIVSRCDFPSDWRFLLIRPVHEEGLSGEPEREAFRKMPPIAQSTTSELCRLLVMELLPAIHERDFLSCADAFYQYGQLAGNCFAKTQGGVYAHPLMTMLAEDLRNRGVLGVGQTSWGPTLFALTESEASAQQILTDYSRDDRFARCAWQVAAPSNSGAEVKIR